MKAIKTSAGYINFRVEGPENGPVVMFGNSLGTSLHIWDWMLPYLPGTYRIVRYDKRGHGLSDCPDGPYTMEQLTDDAATLIKSLDLHDVNFVGLSIGGLIGQGLAHAMPDRIKSLLLMDTAAKIGTKEMWSERIAVIEDAGLQGILEPVMERWFAQPFREDALCVSPLQNMFLRTPVKGYIGCATAIAGADFREDASKLTLPITTIVGSEDGATPPELVRETAALYKCPYHVIEGAAHLPCVDKPEETAKLLIDFLEMANG